MDVSLKHSDYSRICRGSIERICKTARSEIHIMERDKEDLLHALLLSEFPGLGHENTKY